MNLKSLIAIFTLTIQTIFISGMSEDQDESTKIILIMMENIGSCLTRKINLKEQDTTELSFNLLFGEKGRIVDLTPLMEKKKQNQNKSNKMFRKDSYS